MWSKDCSLPQGLAACVTCCMRVEYTRITPDMRLNETIASRHYCVDRYGEKLYCGDARSTLRWAYARA